MLALVFASGFVIQSSAQPSSDEPNFAADFPQLSYSPPKFALSADPPIEVRIGGELREQFEYFENRNFDLSPNPDDGYLLHRVYLNADLQIGGGFRLFTEIGSAYSFGSDDVGPVDENRLFIHQAYAELALPISEDHRISVRGGRQEFVFGSGRLVARRYGANVLRSFDGLRMIYQQPTFRMDLFAVRPIELNQDVFQERSDEDSLFWGLYTVTEIDPSTTTNLDLYYFGLYRPDAEFNGAGRFGDPDAVTVPLEAFETRHSLGARLWGNPQPWDYDVEAVFQFGEFDDQQIRAWTLGSSWGYTLNDVTFQPRLGMKLNFISGDNNPRDNRLGTFNALFPNNSYFSEAAIFAPANLIDVNPNITLHLTENVSLTGMWDFMWRYDADDAIFGPPGVVLFNGDESDQRYIGSALTGSMAWQISDELELNTAYTFFDAGDAIRDGGGEDVHYIAMWLTFRF